MVRKHKLSQVGNDVFSLLRTASHLQAEEVKTGHCRNVHRVQPEDTTGWGLRRDVRQVRVSTPVLAFPERAGKGVGPVLQRGSTVRASGPDQAEARQSPAPFSLHLLTLSHTRPFSSFAVEDT